jgi:membrane-bound inhibitor of C-type lysozyme
MKSRSLVLGMLLLAGCAGGSSLATGTTERTVRFFKCANGEQAEMRFFPAQGVGVLVREDRTWELQQQPAASGFLYSNGPNAVRGKGDELIVEVGRTVPLKCQAK